MTRPSPTPPVRVFTAGEKRELGGATFRDLALDGADFSDGDLQLTSFEGVSLRDCDFSRCDLRGARFVRCDLHGARFAGAQLGGNQFRGSSLARATGLTEEQSGYVSRHGGTFATDWDRCVPTMRPPR